MKLAKYALFVVALSACERATERAEEIQVPVVEPVAGAAEPLPLAGASVAFEPAPPPPIPGPLAPPQIPVVVAATGPLPLPPSYEPGEYRRWKRSLSPERRLQLVTFCRQHPHDFQAACGGIGPLHIPMPPHGDLDNALPAPRGVTRPPSTLPESAFETTEEWVASLTPRQRAYYHRECGGGEDSPHSNLCGPNTPLVVSFDGGPVTFATGGTFAFQPGSATGTDWPTAQTPWLALDVDGDGAITSGAELFGSDTVLPDGSRARHGFEALSQHDANHDGVIDQRDPVFVSLVLWADDNADQRSTPRELVPLASRVTSISLAYVDTSRCDARANCEGQRASLSWRDAHGGERTGAVIDVYLPRR